MIMHNNFIKELASCYEKKNALISSIRNNKLLSEKVFSLTTFLNEHASLSERVYCLLNDIFEQKTCLCNKPLRFNKLNKGYFATCGNEECKRKKLSITSKENNKKKDWKAINEKIKKTNLKKYGYEHNFSKDSSTRKEYEKIMEERYGVKHALQNKDLKEKQKETTINKYGTYNMFELDKVKETMKDKYGSQYAMQNKDIKEKSTLNQKLNKIQIIIDRLKKMDCEYISGLNTYNISFKCNKCGTLYSNQSKQTINRFYLYNKTNIIEDFKSPCLKCYPHDDFRSNFEKEVGYMISEFYKEEIHFNRQYLGAEIDIIIPKFKLAIECNGIYWHSDIHKDKFYHKEKKINIEKRGYHLINIWEDDWNNLAKRKIIISELKKKCNIFNHEINANDCIVELINIKEAKEFFKINSLNTVEYSSLNIGLKCKDSLVYVCSFILENNVFNLINNCEFNSCNVTNGFNKIINYYKKNYGNDLVCILNSDWIPMNDNIYIQNNFSLIEHLDPNEYICDDKRYKLNEFKQTNTLKLENNYSRLFDAGNLKFNLKR